MSLTCAEELLSKTKQFKFQMNVLTEQALLVMIFIQAGQMADWWTIDQSWAAY